MGVEELEDNDCPPFLLTPIYAHVKAVGDELKWMLEIREQEFRD